MKDYTEGRTPDELIPFFPNQMLRETMLSLFLVAMELALVIVMPEGSQQPQEGEAAVEHPAEAYWFFYPLFKVKRLTGSWATALLILAAVSVFTLCIPFIERTRELSLRKRPVSVILSLSVFIGLLYALYLRMRAGWL